MLLIVATQAKFGLQGYCVCKTTLHAFVDRVTGRIDEVVQEFKHEDVSGIRYREVFLEYPEKTLYAALIWRRLQLEEILERLNLNLEKIRRFGQMLHFPEVVALGLSYFR
jgi:hypothetical protein